MHFVVQNVVQFDYSSLIGLRSLIESFSQLTSWLPWRNVLQQLTSKQWHPANQK